MRDRRRHPLRHRHDADRRRALSRRLRRVRAGRRGCAIPASTAASTRRCAARSAGASPPPRSTASPPGVIAWGWQTHGWTQVYTDVHAYPLVVAAGLGARSTCSRTTPGSTGRTAGCIGRGRSARARRPPRQPPADRLGGDGVPPDRGADRRCGNSATGVRHSDPRRGARLGPDRHDGYGRHQPHGLGDFPAVHVEGPDRATG